MKKILAPIIFFFVSFTLTAQNNFKWAEEGAVWHSTYLMYGSRGYSKFVYTGDTIIANKQCQKIRGASEEGGFVGPGEYSIFPKVYKEIYLYKSNDSVFNYRFNNWQLAFKTDAQVGDIWDLGSPDGIKNAYVIVDSVFFETYNGINLRNIRIKPSDSTGIEINFNLGSDSLFHWIPLITGIINEKFGLLTSLINVDSFVPSNGLFCNPIGSLLCYQSNDFGFYQTGSADCFNDLFVNVKELEKNAQILVFPNPANDIVTIATKSNTFTLLEIYNATGQLVHQENMKRQTQINVNTVPQGIYFVKLQTGNETPIVKKLVVQKN